MGKRIVIAGSSFAGLEAAVEIKRRVGDAHEVLVVSPTTLFAFLPSLVWLALGRRGNDDLTFRLQPFLESHGIGFCHETVTGLAPEQHRLLCQEQAIDYDILVLATGSRPNYQAVPGLGPQGGHTESIFTPAHATLTRAAVDRYHAQSGPIVIGAVEGASHFSAVYEFLFQLLELLKRRQEPYSQVTFVTPEPFVGHLGLGGVGSSREWISSHLQSVGVEVVADMGVRCIEPRVIHLADGRQLDFGLAMLAPPHVGAEFLRRTPEQTDSDGFVRVRATYQVLTHPEVYAIGAAVCVPQATPTRFRCAVPKTGHLAQQMARVAAHNVVASLEGKALQEAPPEQLPSQLVLDAGSTGFVLSVDHHLSAREHAWIVPGPEAHFGKTFIEKFFLTQHRGGTGRKNHD